MKKHIRSEIITILGGGATPRQHLVEVVAMRTQSSAQGVYKELSLLRNEQKITIADGQVSLSLLYITQEMEKWSNIHKRYTLTNTLEEEFAQGARVLKYSFDTHTELDLFWTHTYSVLAKHVDPSQYRYMITPHDYFLYAFSDTDSFWVQENIQTVSSSRLIVPYCLPLDKMVVLERVKRGTIFQYLLHENPLHQNEHTYINILGDYIFTATLDTGIHHKIIDYITRTHAIPIAPSDKESLKTLLTEKGTFTLKVEKSHKKSLALQAKLAKYF